MLSLYTLVGRGRWRIILSSSLFFSPAFFPLVSLLRLLLDLDASSPRTPHFFEFFPSHSLSLIRPSFAFFPPFFPIVAVENVFWNSLGFFFDHVSERPPAPFPPSHSRSTLRPFPLRDHQHSGVFLRRSRFPCVISPSPRPGN